MLLTGGQGLQEGLPCAWKTLMLFSQRLINPDSTRSGKLRHCSQVCSVLLLEGVLGTEELTLPVSIPQPVSKGSLGPQHGSTCCPYRVEG